MKTKLLIAMMFLLGTSYSNAQTTHNLDWFAGIGSNVDLTIDVGDTVIWTWTSPNHTVENISGSSVETFNSGFLGPIGSTFSYTFTVVGDNDYFCGVHGPTSMSGTITVQNNLGIDDLETTSSFNLFPNPVTDILQVSIDNGSATPTIQVFDVLGKEILNKSGSTHSLSQIDVSNWNNGLYLIKVSIDNKSTTQRFIKN